MNDPRDMDQTLHRVWAIELEILDALDRFCRERGIRYSLFYGTLLGAVRHGGYIPWDDDIDLLMPREDYRRFAELWKTEGPKDYVLVDRDTYPDYPNNFMKLVKKHTTFLQYDHDRPRSFPKGVFIDIFPADRYAPEGLPRRKQHAECLLNMLFTRNYGSKTGGFVSFAENILLRMPRSLREAWRKRTERSIEKWNGRTDLPVLIPTTVWSCSRVYPASLFEKLSERPFQNRSYFATEAYDAALKESFGNYMKLPPEEKRVWTHHPIILDFEHDYEELQQ